MGQRRLGRANIPLRSIFSAPTPTTAQAPALSYIAV